MGINIDSNEGAAERDVAMQGRSAKEMAHDFICQIEQMARHLMCQVEEMARDLMCEIG